MWVGHDTSGNHMLWRTSGTVGSWGLEYLIDIGGGNQMELVMTVVCPLA